MVRFDNEFGSISISGEVFTILTGDAATNCFGVKGMTVRSVSDGLVYLLKKESMGKGVHIVYNDDNTISIDLNIAVDQGVNIPVICESIIDRVRYQVTKGTGVEIRSINIFIDSVLIG